VGYTSKFQMKVERHGSALYIHMLLSHSQMSQMNHKGDKKFAPPGFGMYPEDTTRNLLHFHHLYPL
jgi:hypothetical protein